MSAIAGGRYAVEIDLASFHVRHWPDCRTDSGLYVAVSGFVESVSDESAVATIEAAYAVNGPYFSRSLLGQYSALVIDPRLRTVCLTQDSLGLVKPFYSRLGDLLRVASDLDLLVALEGGWCLDERYFGAFLGRPTMDRKLTPFAGCCRLAYGQTIVFESGQQKVLRPWHPPVRGAPAHDLDQRRYEIELRAMLDAAIDAVWPSEGVGICELTGGLDSSSVYATALDRGHDVRALTYVAERGMSGDDELFAGEVVAFASAPWDRVSMDTDEVVPERFDGFVSEPQAILYSRQFDAIGAHLRRQNAGALISGSAGDLIFEFGGIAPAFLADKVRSGAWLSAICVAREWAAARGCHRSWLHYLTHIGIPIAWRHLRGESVLDWREPEVPSWLDRAWLDRKAPVRRKSLAPRQRIAEPGRAHLWESVLELAAYENGPQYRRLGVDIRHPLYHRPLVEFMLSLDFRIRRGITGDRRLQRQAMAGRLPTVVLERRSKGSAQELRERHLMESDRWYEAMTNDPRIVHRGWVDSCAWRTAVDQARVGAARFSASFINAVQTELWLRALESCPLPVELSLD